MPTPDDIADHLDAIRDIDRIDVLDSGAGEVALLQEVMSAEDVTSGSTA